MSRDIFGCRTFGNVEIFDFNDSWWENQEGQERLIKVSRRKRQIEEI